jgi:hypothetical protein
VYEKPRGIFTILSRYLSGEAEENHEDSHVSRHSQESNRETSSIKVTGFKAHFGG